VSFKGFRSNHCPLSRSADPISFVVQTHLKCNALYSALIKTKNKKQNKKNRKCALKMD